MTAHRDEGRQLFHPQQIADFRLMAEHRDIVERVIAESTDADPPTRRKVVASIKAEIGRTPAPSTGRLRTALVRLIDVHGIERVRRALDEVTR